MEHFVRTYVFAENTDATQIVDRSESSVQVIPVTVMGHLHNCIYIKFVNKRQLIMSMTKWSIMDTVFYSLGFYSWIS